MTRCRGFCKVRADECAISERRSNWLYKCGAALRDERSPAPRGGISVISLIPKGRSAGNAEGVRLHGTGLHNLKFDARRDQLSQSRESLTMFPLWLPCCLGLSQADAETPPWRPETSPRHALAIDNPHLLHKMSFLPHLAELCL